MGWILLTASGVLMIIGGLGGCLWHERRLRRRNEGMVMFYASLGHELKTPLNAILGFAELLGEDGFDREEQRQFARDIGFSARTLLDTVNRMLDCAKLNAGEMRCHPRPTDLDRLVQELPALLNPLLREKNLRLEIDLPERLPQFELDPEPVRRILLNLIGNAIKFTDRGAIVLRGSFQATDGAHGKLTLKVIDQGPGISAEYRQKLFHPFARDRRQAAAVNGTGLGLYITMQLVKLMRGAIELESAPGKGSCFTVSFPKIRYTPKIDS